MPSSLPCGIDIVTFLKHYCTVFQIKPVLPSETDKDACGRANNGSSPSCRTGWFSATGEFLNFSNRTIIKGDTATFVKQCQNHIFIRLNVFILSCNEVWAGCFLGGRTTLEGSPSCGQGIILTSLEHCYCMVVFLLKKHLPVQSIPEQ